MAGELGVEADLRLVLTEGRMSVDQLAFSETPGRFIISVAPGFREHFESLLAGHHWPDRSGNKPAQRTRLPA
jgi:phosphoribosylformylglycinamidine synthase